MEPGPPYVIKNGLEAKTYGAELTLDAQITPWWKVRTGYSHLQKFITLKSWSMDANGGLAEGNDPKHQVILQSSMDVMKNWEADLMFRFVDRLPNPDAFVPSYSTLDCRIGWNPARAFQCSVLFKNIFLPEHVEFGAPANRREIGREVYGRISLSL